MALSTDKTISVLNDLIETCKDGEYGFQSSAEHVKNPELQQVFTARAAECRKGAEVLQAQVRQLGGEADEGGSASGAIHRGWVAVKGTLSGYGEKAMLEECERGEDAALARYRDALKEDLPPDVRAVVERQYEGVKRNHEQIRTLRDRARAAT
jgi:uncharacterized protein (TIGR02284 family)